MGRRRYAVGPSDFDNDGTLWSDVLVHVGADYWRRNVSDTLRYATRPESTLAPFFADTGDRAATSARVIVLEGALQRGPWTAQGELVAASVDPAAAGSGPSAFHGFHVQATRFLTGERMVSPRIN